MFVFILLDQDADDFHEGCERMRFVFSIRLSSNSTSCRYSLSVCGTINVRDKGAQASAVLFKSRFCIWPALYHGWPRHVEKNSECRARDPRHIPAQISPFHDKRMTIDMADFLE
jgi:hypothetical protein